MRTVTLPLPMFGFIVATRAALGAGLGLLLADRLPPQRRRTLGLALVGVGAATTIPAVRSLSRSIRSSLRRTRPRRSIARDSWVAELDSFSRQHEGWLVSLTQQMPDGRMAVEAHDLPLQGVSRASRESNDIAVTIGDAQRHLTHTVHEAIALCFELTSDRAEHALIIDAKDGSTTYVEFRAPRRVEEVDGLPDAYPMAF
jgi:Family of unknown function (DUF5335)